jgi:hypothetical protein
MWPSILRLKALNYTELMERSLDHVRTKTPSFVQTREKMAQQQDRVFEETVDGSSYDIAWVTEPGELNARLDRQSGCFVLSGNMERKIADILSGPIYRDCDFRKYIIAGAMYKQVFALLRKMNLSSKNIYGDLQGLARSIKMEMQVYTA